jgi:hypothetical protein
MLTTCINEFSGQTLGKWVEQGAPKEIIASGFRREYFQIQHIHWLGEIKSGIWWWAALPEGEEVFDLGHGITVSAGTLSPLVPVYEPRIISEDERTATLINVAGQTVKRTKESWKTGWGMPMFLDWPVKDRATWNEHKKRLDPNTPERWPSDWNAYVQKMNGKTEPLSLEVGSFYGFLREWKFMMPRYKKITDLLHSYGVDVIYLDSDGNLNELIPLWLEVGINLIWPFEVAAGNDAVAIRKKYGKDLIIAGAIDKRALAKGKEAIRGEVMSKVPFLLEQGGYFPSVDHHVPPDVTFENYCYYINLMREVAGLEKLSFY